MKKNLLNLLITSTMVLSLSGCGSISSDEPTSSNPIYDRPGTLVIWDDDILGDPDGMGTLSLVLQMHKEQTINLLAVGTHGIDTNNRKTVGISAEMYYQGVEDIPIGINTSPNQRVSEAANGMRYPKLYPEYNGSYKDISEFPNDGCVNDAVGCGTRREVVELYCELLENSPRKVAIVTGGQWYNVSDLLDETQKCNGKQVIKDKVSVVVVTTGRSTDIITGQNFGYQDNKARDSMLNVINNLPVPLVLGDMKSPDYQKIPYGKVGQSFQNYNIESPTAFVYASPRYGNGLKSGHSYLDALGLFYVVYGDNGQFSDGGTSVDKTFQPQSKNAKIVNSASGRHFERVGKYHLKSMHDEIERLLKK